LRLKVAVQVQADPTADVQTMAPGTGPHNLEAAFTALMAQPGQLVERVTDPDAAAWYVRVVAQEVSLVPASGWSHPAAREAGDKSTQAVVPPQFTLGSVTASAALQAALQTALTRIARAQHLLSLTTAEDLRANPGEGVDVGLDLLRFPTKDAAQGTVVPYTQ